MPRRSHGVVPILVVACSSLVASSLPAPKGAADDLSTDRGWRGRPGRMAGSLKVADTLPPPRIRDLESGGLVRRPSGPADQRAKAAAPGLYYSKQTGTLHLDTLGVGERHLGTDQFRPLADDFVIELELSSLGRGECELTFGLSDAKSRLFGAHHALFLAFRAERSRLLVIEDGGEPVTAGELRGVGLDQRKRVRLGRIGHQVAVEFWQGEVLEGRVAASVSSRPAYTWLGSHLTTNVRLDRERSVASIDRIRGLDLDRPVEEAVRAERVAYHFAEDDRPRRLVGRDGRAIGRHQVESRYGKPEGFVIKCDGEDVCSARYAERAALRAPLRPVSADLSDQAGWPAIAVKPGCVAIDPRHGRFKFSDGRKGTRSVGTLDWPAGLPTEVVVKGEHAFIASQGQSSSDNFLVANVSDPARPRLVASTRIGSSFRLSGFDVQGGRAYVPVGSSLAVLDVAEPAAPRLLSSRADPRPRSRKTMRAVAVRGRYAYAAVFGEGLQVLDLADSSGPSLVGACTTDGMGHARRVLAARNFVYVADGNALKVYNVAEPQRPLLVGSKDGQSTRGKKPGRQPDAMDDLLDIDMFADDTGDKRSAGAQAARVYKRVQDPRGLAIAEDCLLVADGEAGLTIIEIGDPYDPQFLTTYRPPMIVEGVPAAVRGVAASGKYAFLTVEGGMLPREDRATGEIHEIDSGGGLHILDISSPPDPTRVSRCVVPHGDCKFRDVVVRGDRVYVTDERYGLWLIDIAEITKPTIVGGVPTQGFLCDLAIEGDVAYLASGGGQGVWAADLSEPSRLRVVGRYHTGFSCRAIAVRRRTLYVAFGEWAGVAGIAVIDATDPAKMKLVRLLKARGCHQLHIEHETLYCSSGEAYDLSTPSAPRLIGQIRRGYVYVADQLAYLARPECVDGFAVFDVSHPAQPTAVGALEIDLDSLGRNGLVVCGGKAAVAAGARGVAMIDVANPRRPRLMNLLKSNLVSAVDVDRAGRYLYVTDSAAGVKTFDVSEPGPGRLIDMFPRAGARREARSHRLVVRDGYGYRVREDGLDVLELPLPCEAPAGEVSVECHLAQ